MIHSLLIVDSCQNTTHRLSILSFQMMIVCIGMGGRGRIKMLEQSIGMVFERNNYWDVLVWQVMDFYGPFVAVYCSNCSMNLHCYHARNEMNNYAQWCHLNTAVHSSYNIPYLSL